MTAIIVGSAVVYHYIEHELASKLPFLDGSTVHALVCEEPVGALPAGIFWKEQDVENVALRREFKSLSWVGKEGLMVQEGDLAIIP